MPFPGFPDTVGGDSRQDGFPGSSNEFWEAFPDSRSTFASSPDQSFQSLLNLDYSLALPSSIPEFALASPNPNAHWHIPEAQDWSPQPDIQSAQYREPVFYPRDPGPMPTGIQTTHLPPAILDAGRLSMSRGYLPTVGNGSSPIYGVSYSPFSPPGSVVPSRQNSFPVLPGQTEMFSSGTGSHSEHLLRSFAGLTLNSSPVPAFQPMAPRPPMDSPQRRNSHRGSSVANRPYPPMRTSSLPVQATPPEETIPHFCKWVKDDGSLCNACITRETVPQHLTIHGVKNMAHDNPVYCRWYGCRIRGNQKEMKRESIVRHIREKHLRYRRTL